jgi:LysR family transcriptional activator of nhaA
MDSPFNYRHLHYFWVVATEGGMARGAARLGMAVQTVSAQVRELERALGHALFKPEGRGLALTDAGRVALAQADEIFRLGAALPQRVRDAAAEPVQRLTVGLADGLPKLVVHRLLQPVLDTPHLRLQCHERAFDLLLADLALHKLDVVLADRPAPPNPNLKLYSHSVGQSTLSWYSAPVWAEAAQQGFPGSLAQVPVLLPTAQSIVRGQLDQWFERVGVRPRVVGEFEDSALLKTFGAGGMGVFPAVDLVADDLRQSFGVVPVGACSGVVEPFFAIGTERRVQHPLVARLLGA